MRRNGEDCVGAIFSRMCLHYFDWSCKSLFQVQLKLLATQNSFHFFDRALIPIEIYEDKDEWQVSLF